MAKSTQTFRKRQREHKLREKAQLKRERRQERNEIKKAQHTADESSEAFPTITEFESDAESELDVEESS